MAVSGMQRRGTAARSGRRWLLCVVMLPVVALLLTRGSRAADKPPKSPKQVGPSLRLSFQQLGVPALSKSYLEAGGSMMTVHLLDETHMMLTYSLRKLIPRLVGDPKDDDDRLVGAALVELPSGKVLATTEWHMHDHGRYLWSLGQGRFLVRIGDSVSTMTPLANLGEKDPFERVAFPGRTVAPVAVLVSEDGGLVTLETLASIRRAKSEVVFGDEIKRPKPKTFAVLDFYRLKNAGGPGAPVEVEHVGSARSAEPVLLPLDSTGYLNAEETAADRWSMSFTPFAGKRVELGKIDSTCSPRLEMVTHAEFVAMTCRGTEDSVRMVSYGLDGQETWEEQLGEYGTPTFVHAPAAARFAISNTATAAGNPSSPQYTGPVTRQEVRVYQVASGDLLLRVEASPVFKTAENFDLSADGQRLVIVKGEELVFYKLPAPGKRDLKDMAEVAKFAPPAASGPVDLKRLVARQPPEVGPEDVAAPELDRPELVRPQTPTQTSTQTPVFAQASAQASASDGGKQQAATASGDDSGPRKVPTLLLPGEKPEFQDKPVKPK